jgi:ribosomal protein L35
MGKLKTRKALLKRLKITGRKKILKRIARQGKYNAKESGNITRRKRKASRVSPVDKKIIKKALPNI